MTADNTGSVKCLFCDEQVTDTDVRANSRFFDEYGNKRLAHQECALRIVLGGIGHLANHEHWCRTEHDPDAGLSYRESARLVLEWTKEHDRR